MSEVFEDSRIKIQGKPGRSDCALLADGMVIRKEIICYIMNNLPICQGKYVAFVHYDNIAPENSKIIAFRALVDMLVMEMPSWLFFLKDVGCKYMIQKCDVNMQTSIIKFCLSTSAEHGLHIWSVTCNGTSTNLNTFKNEGFVSSHD